MYSTLMNWWILMSYRELATVRTITMEMLRHRKQMFNGFSFHSRVGLRLVTKNTTMVKKFSKFN